MYIGVTSVVTLKHLTKFVVNCGQVINAEKLMYHKVLLFNDFMLKDNVIKYKSNKCIDSRFISKDALLVFSQFLFSLALPSL